MNHQGRNSAESRDHSSDESSSDESSSDESTSSGSSSTSMVSAAKLESILENLRRRSAQSDVPIPESTLEMMGKAVNDWRNFEARNENEEPPDFIQFFNALEEFKKKMKELKELASSANT